MAKSNNKEMENNLEPTSFKMRRLSDESHLKITKDDYHEADAAQATQDDDCDRMLNIFTKMIQGLHKYNKEQKKTEIVAPKMVDIPKQPEKPRKVATRGRPRKSKAGTTESTEVHQKNSQDGITRFRNASDDKSNMFEQDLNLQNHAFTMQTYQGQQNGDPRLFLREKNEPNSQLPYIISKYIFKVKNNRKWILEKEAKNRYDYSQTDLPAKVDVPKNTQPKPDTYQEVGAYNQMNYGTNGERNYSRNYNMASTNAESHQNRQLPQNQFLSARSDNISYPPYVNTYGQQYVGGGMNFQKQNVARHLPGLKNILNFQEAQPQQMMNNTVTRSPPNFVFQQQQATRLPPLNNFAQKLNASTAQMVPNYNTNHLPTMSQNNRNIPYLATNPMNFQRNMTVPRTQEDMNFMGYNTSQRNGMYMGPQMQPQSYPVQSMNGMYGGYRGPNNQYNYYKPY